MKRPSSDAEPWWALPSAGTRVIVTGSSGGLGRALCTALLELDCRVAGLDIAPDSPTALDHYGNADLTDPKATRAAIDAASTALGGLDSLVGTAGVVDTIHRAASFPPDRFVDDINANLIAPFFVAQAAFPHLKSAGGSIVFTSSVTGLDGVPGQASYAASKAGIGGLTRTLAAEWAHDRVRVNAIAPGMFDSPKVLALPDEIRNRFLAPVPLGRTASLAEIVGPILFLMSPAASYMTGQLLRIDGGTGLGMAGIFK